MLNPTVNGRQLDLEKVLEDPNVHFVREGAAGALEESVAEESVAEKSVVEPAVFDDARVRFSVILVLFLHLCAHH